VTSIDVRDIRELEREGRVPIAFHCLPGILEFWLNPASPYREPVLAEESALYSFVPALNAGRASPSRTKTAVSAPE
jgi:hypothetical protein